MENPAFEFRVQLQNRTKKFAVRIVKLYQALPKTGEAQVVGKQILRAGTSVAANYRAACRARSAAEFLSKISIVVEEADETLFWIELLQETNIIKAILLEDLYRESEEIIKIMTTARKNSKKYSPS
jgi:four helix bundle protein